MKFSLSSYREVLAIYFSSTLKNNQTFQFKRGKSPMKNRIRIVNIHIYTLLHFNNKVSLNSIMLFSGFNWVGLTNFFNRIFNDAKFKRIKEHIVQWSQKYAHTRTLHIMFLFYHKVLYIIFYVKIICGWLKNFQIV